VSGGTPSQADDGWQVIGLHHIAFAHPPGSGTEQALGKFLGLASSHEEQGPGFVEKMLPISTDCYVQLLEATGDGVVTEFVSHRGSALHHIAFEVTNIDAAIAGLRSAGARLVDDKPRPGGLRTRIAFVHPSSFDGLLVELVERSELPDHVEI